ncbi:hypothetical protein DSECCO2_375390 [anaerobic digester metagenome]
MHIFKSGSGIYSALGMAAINEFIDASLLTTYAWTDFFNFTGIHFVRPFRICQKRASQHHHVAHIVPKCLFCEVRIAKLSYSHNGNLYTCIRLDALIIEIILGVLAYLQEAACGHACRWVGQPPVIVASQVNVEHVNAGSD